MVPMVPGSPSSTVVPAPWTGPGTNAGTDGGPRLEVTVQDGLEVDRPKETKQQNHSNTKTTYPGSQVDQVLLFFNHDG